MKRRADLAAYLDQCSEDDLIEEVYCRRFANSASTASPPPATRTRRWSTARTSRCGTPLLTQHVLYFGIQAKKGKLDASGVTKAGNANVAEIHNQALMMLAHEIFDPEINRRVLVDHAFIVAGGEITKQARNWIGNALDASKHSQIMFLDRDDTLNLFVVTNLPLPEAARPAPPKDPWLTSGDEPPF